MGPESCILINCEEIAVGLTGEKLNLYAIFFKVHGKQKAELYFQHSEDAMTLVR